jgi:alkanesulfonate monooxygenase SsuD/methylene tetrahydromethanopterin reductase-like flavin-dependent oxidoreductase (luciferase family)
MTTSGTPVSFGLTLPQRGMLFDAVTGPQLVDLARRADENPLFDSVWVGDNLFTKPRPDSLTLLGGLATATSRVKLAVGCMASFTVRDPIVFAYQWATLDLLSAGRMLLAACTGLIAGGASEAEGRPWGVKDGQRASRLAENIDICRALWTGKQTSFAGRYTNFEGVTLQPRPVQDPCPIWIAANPRPDRPEVVTGALRRVARKADGWMTVEMFPGAFAVLWNRLQELLVEEGKDPAAFPNITYHNININADGEAGLAESKRFLDAYYGPVFSLPMVQAWTALGSPEECIAHLRALRDAGAKAITLRITSWDQEGQYRRLVEEVLPNV